MNVKCPNKNLSKKIIFFIINMNIFNIVKNKINDFINVETYYDYEENDDIEEVVKKEEIQEKKKEDNTNIFSLKDMMMNMIFEKIINNIGYNISYK